MVELFELCVHNSIIRSNAYLEYVVVVYIKCTRLFSLDVPKKYSLIVGEHYLGSPISSTLIVITLQLERKQWQTTATRSWPRYRLFR